MARFDSVLLFGSKSANIWDIGTKVGEGADIDGIFQPLTAGGLENKSLIPMLLWSQKRHTSKTSKIAQKHEEKSAIVIHNAKSA